MAEEKDDYRRFMERKHFLGEIEQAIRLANRKIIRRRIPSLDKEAILKLAVSIAKLRGHYLEAAFKMAARDDGERPSVEDVNELRERRQAFEEARSAFDALRDAVEKGYLPIQGGESAGEDE